jgi:hypothetical protein
MLIRSILHQEDLRNTIDKFLIFDNSQFLIAVLSIKKGKNHKLQRGKNLDKNLQLNN